jgi:hypothetical protein
VFLFFPLSSVLLPYLDLLSGAAEQAAPEKGVLGPTERFDKEAVDKRVDEQNQLA